MKTRTMLLIGILIILIVTYFLGPRPPDPVYSNNFPVVSSNLETLQSNLQDDEAKLPLREDNQARIIFFGDSIRQTEYSVVYLHGFAGSYRDGYPVNIDIANEIGANTFFNRMPGHGMRPPYNLDSFSPEAAWENAKMSLSIGKQLGEKVLVMSTSTGGTLATKLASEFPNDVYALINLSPNYKDDQFGAFLLNTKWGYEIATLVSFGSHKKIDHEEAIAKQYWDTIYTSKALVDLQVLVQTTMKPETFREVESPVLTLYYQDNEIEEDTHVEVDIYPEIHAQFKTLPQQNILERLETPKTHFIASDIKSKDIDLVRKRILLFCKKLGIIIPKSE